MFVLHRIDALPISVGLVLLLQGPLLCRRDSLVALLSCGLPSAAIARGQPTTNARASISQSVGMGGDILLALIACKVSEGRAPANFSNEERQILTIEKLHVLRTSSLSCILPWVSSVETASVTIAIGAHDSAATVLCADGVRNMSRAHLHARAASRRIMCGCVPRAKNSPVFVSNV